MTVGARAYPKLTEAQLRVLRRALTPRMTKYIPHTPTAKQAAFLVLPHREAFYGGAAGGGKSDALLMGALQYVDLPGYAAIIFRRTYADLSLPGALMERSNEWLLKTDAKWSDKDKTWHFPSGSTLTFGYLEHDLDRYRYQSAEFNYIAFDEVTQFTENQYRYLFSRLRRMRDDPWPNRMRAAANPGGVGHEWVRDRFVINGRENNRVFIPAWLRDNPYLDQDDYAKSLAELDPVTRRQLQDGDWGAALKGDMFDRNWFEIVDRLPPKAAVLRRVRYWDLAATEADAGKKKGFNPDWTVGLKLALCDDGYYYVEHVARFQASPAKVEDTIKTIAEIDGRLKTVVWMEQEPGSSGVNTIDHYRRSVLRGYVFKGDKPSGSKEERARPASAAAEHGFIKLVKGPWNELFLDECESFPESEYKDQVDTLSGAFARVNKHRGGMGIRKPREGAGARRSIWS